MAKNLLGGESPKNFARGEAPPAGSYEWAAVGKAPPTRPQVAKKTPIIVATMRETIVLEKKPKRLKWFGLGALVGLIVGHKIGSF